jgi:hypothetical protein
VGAATIVLAVYVAVRDRGRSPIVQGALISCAFILCYGWKVWEFPTEALRVMAPAQVMLLIAVLTTNGSRVTRVPGLPAPQREPAAVSR